MPGWLANGMPQVTALITNGNTTYTEQVSINGTLSGGTPITYTQVGASAMVSIDTEQSGGAPPQSVAASAFQIACANAGLFYNSASSTAGAATLNTVSGIVETESLTTAAGSTYTFTLTNSLISTANTPPSPVPQVALYDVTNTAGATQVNSITNGTGSVVVVFQNTGTAAWNGKRAFVFHI